MGGRDRQPVVVRNVTELGHLQDVIDQALHTEIWKCVLLLHTSHRKILNMVHVSSMKSCCMNGVVEKGRVIQHSEDPMHCACRI